MANTYEELMRPLYDRLSSPSLAESDEEIPQARRLPAMLAPVTGGATDGRDNAIADIHKTATETVKGQLLAHIYAHDHVFFENLIIDVLLAMGYGKSRRDFARRLGRSHDGGIDGVIAQDELGLDILMLQAKRLKPGSSVSGAQVRNFIGALEANQAGKGVFFTTGQFTTQARAATKSISRRVILVNGDDLTGLMIRHNIGVCPTETYEFKRIDRSYFARASNATDSY